ncbi:MAG: hypothetical protein UT50_C0015G0007 [Candidatus Moranbacteria bacterium GW2011_GWA2_39_41]|nr:MAG: hypothetical protein UT50_C0015G0007 [Candidatus Moranbacteria bacterium GW2011_GWA2_39_41]
MQKYFWGGAIIIAIGAVLLGWGNYFALKTTTSVSPTVNQGQTSPSTTADPQVVAEQPVQKADDLSAPLKKSKERVTKKPFGIFITTQNSPVQPERFRGFHTGADFEIFPEELNADVPVQAICAGKIVVKKSASGYGGVLVQNCTIDSQTVTVIYGHLKLASVAKNLGNDLAVGEAIGILGANESAETSGERKHLHLGMHKGSAINILGYAQNKSELSGWLDPCVYVCK